MSCGRVIDPMGAAGSSEKIEELQTRRSYTQKQYVERGFL